MSTISASNDFCPVVIDEYDIARNVTRLIGSEYDQEFVEWNTYGSTSRFTAEYR